MLWEFLWHLQVEVAKSECGMNNFCQGGGDQSGMCQMPAFGEQAFLLIFKTCRWLGLVLFLSAAILSSRASLVIMIYHNETLYIASDSAGTDLSSGKRVSTVQKIYPFSTNCCASITGLASYYATNQAGEIEFNMSLADSLRRACTGQMNRDTFLDKKIYSIATQVNQDFASYYNQSKQWGGDSDGSDEIMLQFAGYNVVNDCFIVKSSKLDRTNAIMVYLVKDYRGANDDEPIILQGEPDFLRALLSGSKPELLDLASDKFKETCQSLNTTQPITDSSVTNFLLEMFTLHVANAKKYGYDRGWVGPPYRIFKITKDKVVELTFAPPVLAADSLQTTNKPINSDDVIINAVMDKLAKTYMQNDYAYAFEVMYAPMLESMGGKELAVENVARLNDQMKKFRMSMISWKAKKPYSYVRCRKHLYAIIPYESLVALGERKIRQEGYQLGIKTDDSPWQFIGADKLTPEIMDTFFPDFPRNYQLPKVSQTLE